MRATMLYVSELAGRPVVDATGRRVATLRDFVVRIADAGYPALIGVVARDGRRDFFVPIAQVARIDEQGAQLATSRVDLRPFERRAGEVLLENDVLDRQIIDVESRKVVRANDVAIDEREGRWRLVGVDVSPWAVVRRIAPAGLVGGRRRELRDWAQLEPFASTVPEVQLHVPHDKLAQLHPAEIARIVESVAYPQATEIVSALDDETAAETLEVMDEQLQADLVKHMDEARAADVLEEMAPDDAADLLADLPPDKADALLDEMEREESEEVERLLTYSEDTAGGMMTTEYVALPGTYTTREAIEAIRTDPEKPDFFYDVYVLGPAPSRELVGVVTLRNMLLASGDERLADYMRTDLETVGPEMPADDVAQRMSDYNLLALPVVDEQRALLGVVTLDDAMDAVLPESTRHRVPRVFR